MEYKHDMLSPSLPGAADVPFPESGSDGPMVQIVNLLKCQLFGQLPAPSKKANQGMFAIELRPHVPLEGAS